MMRDAPYLYAVRMWLHPTRGKEVLAWLDGGHLAEVTSQPGFLWCRRFRLAENAADGWHAYVVLYGLESKAAMADYFANPIREKFARESAPFGEIMRSERSWGSLDFSASPPG